MDVAVAHPTSANVPATVNGERASIKVPLAASKTSPFVAGNSRHASKLGHNTPGVCAQHGFDFLPFILETTGAIHPEAVTFLSDLAFRAAQRRVSDDNFTESEAKRILRRWKYQFSTTIRKAHARAILDRLESLRLKPHPLVSRRELFSTRTPLLG